MAILFSQQKLIEYWNDKSQNEGNCFEACRSVIEPNLIRLCAPNVTVLNSLSNLHNLHSFFQTSFRTPLSLPMLFEALQV